MGTDVFAISATSIEINKAHPAYPDLKKWFDLQ
jgi:hypothetical protein